MSYVNDKIDVRGDGAVIIYRRPTRDGTINDVFQMRIRVPLPASKGYFRGTTKESDQGRATQVALNKFDELYNRIKSGGTFLTKSFKDLFDEWKVHCPQVSNESDSKYVEWSINRIGNYPLTVFVEKKRTRK